MDIDQKYVLEISQKSPLDWASDVLPKVNNSCRRIVSHSQNSGIPM